MPPKGFEKTEDFRFHPLPGVYCIVGGKSPRGDWGHAVVMYVKDGFNFELSHDPHPDGTGIVGFPNHVDFIVPIDPSRVFPKTLANLGEQHE